MAKSIIEDSEKEKVDKESIERAEMKVIGTILRLRVVANHLKEVLGTEQQTALDESIGELIDALFYLNGVTPDQLADMSEETRLEYYTRLIKSWQESSFSAALEGLESLLDEIDH